MAGVERVDAAGNRRELHPLVHRRGTRRPLRLAESKRGARSNRPFAPGRAVAVTVTSYSIRLIPASQMTLAQRATSPRSAIRGFAGCLLWGVMNGPKAMFALSPFDSQLRTLVSAAPANKRHRPGYWVTPSASPNARAFAERILWKICRDCWIN